MKLESKKKNPNKIKKTKSKKFVLGNKKCPNKKNCLRVYQNLINEIRIK